MKRCNVDRRIRHLTFLFLAFIAMGGLPSARSHAAPLVGISHRISSYTPAKPNTMVLELKISNLSHLHLQNIEFEANSPEILPASQSFKIPGSLHSFDQTTAYWTIQTPVSYQYLLEGAPIFMRGTAHSDTAGTVSFSVTSEIGERQ